MLNEILEHKISKIWHIQRALDDSYHMIAQYKIMIVQYSL